MRTVLDSLIKPSTEAKNALIGVGLSTQDFVDKSGKMKSMADIFKLMNEHTKNMSKYQKGVLFSTLFGAQGSAAANILSRSADELEKLNKKVQESYKGQGYVQELAKKNQGSVKKQMAQFKEASEAAKMSLGKALLPAMRDASVEMAKFFNSKEGKQGLKDISKLIGNIANAVVGLMKILSKHKKAVIAIVKTLGRLLIFHFAIKGISKVVNDLKLVKSAAKATKLNKLLKWTAKISTKGAKSALKGLKKAAQLTAKGVKLAFNGMLKIVQKVALGFKMAFLTNPFGIALLALTAIGVALFELYKHSAKFRKFVNGLAKVAKKALDKIIKFFKNIPKTISKIWKSVTGFFGKGWKSIKNGTSKGIKNVKKDWSNFNKSVKKSASKMWKDTKKKFSDGWNGLKKGAKKGKDNIVKAWKNMGNMTLKSAKKFAKDHPKAFKNGYKIIQSYTKIWKDLLSGDWGKLFGDLKDIAKNIKKFVTGIFKEMYDWLNKKTGGRLGDMVKAFQDKFGSLKDIIHNCIKGVREKVADLANAVIRPFNNMLSGLKNGINWVLEKVGASKITASWKIPTVSYAKGTPNMQGANGTHKGGLALVNDAPGEHYQEMFKLPNGKVGLFPKQRNMIVPLPQGSSVLSGEDTYKLTSMLGIPAYANGIGKFFKGVWNSAVDLVDEAEDILKKPVEFLKEVFKKHIGSFPAKGIAEDIIIHFPNKLANLAIGWVKKLFSDFGSDNAKNGDWAPVIKRAARKMHVDISQSDVSHILRVIQGESGGNASVVQKVWDINMANGTPAQGLLQYVPSTFAAYAVAGHHNIKSGYDQLLAMFNDSTWRRDLTTHGWGPSGHRRMAWGGKIDTNQLIEVAEQNKPEYIIPTDPVKRPRAWQLMHELTSQFTREQLPTNNIEKDNAEIRQLNNKFDDLLGMFSQLLGLNSQQIKAIRESGFDKTKQYQQQALDQRLANYQGY